MEPAHKGLAVFDRSANNIMKTKYIRLIAKNNCRNFR